VLEPSREVKLNPVSIDGLEEVFEVAGTAGTGIESTEEMSRTYASTDPGQPGQDSIEATEVLTYLSTAEAAKLARVDSRTVRRWFDQKKVRGQFSKGKLLIVQEDLLASAEQPEVVTAGTPGTESGTFERQFNESENDDPGRPGQSADKTDRSALIVSSEFLDRIERLSRENGVLRAMLDEQRRENEQLKLLSDSQHKAGWWLRFCSWFKA
jgi:hypothetical protein